MLEAGMLYNDLKADNILAVKWGPGVGSASVINGVIYKGSNYQSSELGHNMVANSNNRCRCGKFGCLETVLSENAICSYILASFAQHPSSAIADAVSKYGIPGRKTLRYYLELNYEPLRTYLDGFPHNWRRSSVMQRRFSRPI
jgi:predicted NBD/HSP70 family sugar kinase